MKSQVLINSDALYTEVAFIEEGKLVEFYVEDKNAQKIVGNIYKGRIDNILSGMDAAFVSIGLNKNAFLHAGDTLFDKTDLSDKSVVPKKLAFKLNDEIMVQVVKDETGIKGARLTTNITYPGRLLVLMQSIDFVGISNRISNKAKREWLTGFVTKNKRAGTGFIIRTQCQFASEQEILDEMQMLYQYQAITLERYKKAHRHELLFSEGDLIFRTVRDKLSTNIESIIVSNQQTYETIKDYLSTFAPSFVDKLLLHGSKTELMRYYKVSQQIDSILAKRVNLSNGAYLFIEKTEALNIIDVNSGKFTASTLEQTVFEANMLAAEEIARQLRLRNISGIILVDFIDMEEEAHKHELIKHLKACVKSDPIKTNVMGMTQLGLVEITRKKIRNDIHEIMLDTCPHCGEASKVPSAHMMAAKIKSELYEIMEKLNPPSVLLTVSGNIFCKLFGSTFKNECAELFKNCKIYMDYDDVLKNKDFRISLGASIDENQRAKLLF